MKPTDRDARNKVGFRVALALLGLGILATILGGPILARIALVPGSTVWCKFPSPPTGRFEAIVYRYPRLHDIPEALGLGQGFVDLVDTSTGQILKRKHLELAEQATSVMWRSNRVFVHEVEEWWDLPTSR